MKGLESMRMNSGQNQILCSQLKHGDPICLSITKDPHVFMSGTPQGPSFFLFRRTASGNATFCVLEKHAGPSQFRWNNYAWRFGMFIGKGMKRAFEKAPYLKMYASMFRSQTIGFLRPSIKQISTIYKMTSHSQQVVIVYRHYCRSCFVWGSLLHPHRHLWSCRFKLHHLPPLWLMVADCSKSVRNQELQKTMSNLIDHNSKSKSKFK